MVANSESAVSDNFTRFSSSLGNSRDQVVERGMGAVYPPPGVTRAFAMVSLMQISAALACSINSRLKLTWGKGQ